VTQHQVRRVQRRQQESLMAVDEAVARLVATLRETGRLENTLFVFTSDNGMSWGEHNVLFKSVPYTAATAVPLVVRWDAQVPAGEVDSRLALNLDITTTIARATSAPMLTAGLDLLGKGRRDGSVLEAPPEPRLGRPAYCGWRTSDWTFTRYATGEEELYSDQRDPYQLTNVAQNPENEPQLSQMRHQARRFCDPVPPEFSW
jgi:arylsulfatase A-like enzyme